MTRRVENGRKLVEGLGEGINISPCSSRRKKKYFTINDIEDCGISDPVYSD